MYKLNSAEAAVWLRKEKDMFVKHFSGMSIVREKMVQ